MQCFTMEGEDTAKFNSFQNALTPAKKSKNDDRPNYEKITFTRIRSWDRNCLIAFVGIVLIAVVVTAVVVPILLIEDTGKTVYVTTAPPTLENNGAKQSYTQERTTQYETTTGMDGLATGESLTTYAGTSMKESTEMKPSGTTPSEGETSPTTLQASTSTPAAATVTPGVEIREDYSIQKAGTWSNWADYGSCSVSCGSGQQNRTRVCLTANSFPCVGTASQIAVCYMGACPPKVTYGKWNTWLGWGECSTTCGGGTKTRTRVCVKSSESALDCVGNQTQTKGCNTQQCPDCSKQCDLGTLNAECTLCICSTTLSGQVFSTKSMTLRNVSISPSTDPQQVLFTTLNDGKFTLENQCFQNVYLFTKTGYISTTVSGSSMNGKLTMEKIEPLTIVRNPQNKMRLVGESLTLCCAATGKPPAEYYEWFKDGEILMTVDATEQTDLVVDHADLFDSGRYACRANNEYTAIKSSEAIVNVQAKEDDFCQTIPSSSLKRLPDGCLMNGESVFDEGYCSPSPCKGNVSDSGQCADTEPYCCGPVSFSRVDVPCTGNATMSLLLVTGCGCSKCSKLSVTISGIASGNDGSPLFWGDILHNGTVIGSTSTSGTFTLNIQTEAERVPLVFKDTFDEVFVDTLYTVTVPKQHTGSIFINVKMLEGDTIKIHTGDEAEVALVSSITGKAIANITFPESAIYKENGDLYEGNVDITLAVVDVSNTASQLAAPGDFSAVNEEGDLEQLDTFGMFAIQLKDETGNPLAIPGEVSILVSEEQVGNATNEHGISDVKLWRLDTTTGNWDFESEILLKDISRRRKRQALRQPGQVMFETTVRGLDINTAWFNFDYFRETMCYSKIRVYSDPSLTEQVADASISVVVSEQGTTGLRSLSRFRANSDKRDQNAGYCIAHLCSNRNDIRIDEVKYFADYDGRELYPALRDKYTSDVFSAIGLEVNYNEDSGISDDNVINIKKADVHLDRNGPFYDHNWIGFKAWMYSDSCSSANSSGNFFKFYDGSCEYSYTPYTFQEPKEMNECPPENYLSWHSPAMYAGNVPYRVCFAKIKVESFSTGKSKFRAHSKVSKGNGGIYSGSDYGIRDSCDARKRHTVCVEIKDPSRVACNKKEDAIPNPVDVDVTISNLKQSRFIVTNISELFKRNDRGKAEISPDNSSVTFTIEVNSEGVDYGIYCHFHMEKKVATQFALDKCYSGNEAISSVESDQNPAVTFRDVCTPMADIIFVVDTSASMNTRRSLNDVKMMMKSFANSAPLGQNLFRIAVFTLTTNAVAYLNLDSPTSYNISTIHSSIDSVVHSYSVDTPADVFTYIDMNILGSDADRVDAKNVVIFVSDGGEPTTGLTTAVGALSSSAKILAVGTTNEATDLMRPYFNETYNLWTSLGSQLVEKIEEYVCG